MRPGRIQSIAPGRGAHGVGLQDQIVRFQTNSSSCCFGRRGRVVVVDIVRSSLRRRRFFFLLQLQFLQQFFQLIGRADNRASRARLPAQSTTVQKGAHDNLIRRFRRRRLLLLQMPQHGQTAFGSIDITRQHGRLGAAFVLASGQRRILQNGIPSRGQYPLHVL